MDDPVLISDGSPELPGGAGPEGPVQEYPQAREGKGAGWTIAWTALGVVGAFLLPYMHLVGAAGVIFSATLLMIDGRKVPAIAAVPVGAVLFLLTNLGNWFFALVSLGVGLAMVVAVIMVRGEGSRQIPILLCMVVAGASLAGADHLSAVASGGTLISQIQAMGQSITDLYSSMGVDKSTLGMVGSTLDTMQRIWPSTYFFEGYFFVLVAIIVAVLFFRRKAAGYSGHYLREFDILFVIVVPVGAALLLMAWAAITSASYAGVLNDIGLNLLICTRMLLVIQGIAATLGFTHRVQLGTGKIVITFVLLGIGELCFAVLAFLGLIDLWMNVRRLPRNRGDDDGIVPEDEEDQGDISV